jgi:molybdate transport system ATP-binding protein
MTAAGSPGGARSTRFDLDLAVPLDRFELRVRWETDEPSLGVFGPSGAGKTTLLLALAGLRRGARGRIRFGGETWLDTERGVMRPPEARGIGYVPQDALLFPHRSVLGNILAGRRRARSGAAPAIDPQRVLDVLALRDLEHRSVADLSGGERQRVALGRALCSGPRLLLLDEPLAGLDLPLRRRVLNDLLAIREAFGLPTLFVSHDPAEVRVMSREVIVLSAGRMAGRGRPGEIFARPEIFPLARAEGMENVLQGVVVERSEGAAVMEMEPGLRVVVPGADLERGARVAIGLGAEDLILATGDPAGLSARNRIPGRIRDVRPAGGEVLVVVDIGTGGVPLVVSITAEAERQLGIRPGREVLLLFKAGACRVIAARGAPKEDR